MIINRCRVCGQDLFSKPLLVYENMPKYAQYLPDKETIKSDAGVNIEVCQCSGCGLVQLNNEPVPYYKEVIRAAGISDEMLNFRRNQFTNFIQEFDLKNKSIIEIGCGCGEYLSLMENCGVKVFGLEFLSESIDQCIEKGLQVERGFIDNPNITLKKAPFDAFYVLNFLEHLPDVNSTLRGIYNNLKDEAIGLIEVPSFDMIYRNRLFSEFIPDHLFYFTEDTLKSTLCFSGFEIIECKEVWHNYILSAIVRKKTRLDLNHFYKYQDKIKHEIYKYLEKFNQKEVAIWGAGHQALTIISLAHLDEKIKYVIDSASFKQGKFTPATHLPIVAPEELRNNPVEAVIVMGASYSDEIAKIIRREYNCNIEISILRDFGLEEVLF